MINKTFLQRLVFLISVFALPAMLYSTNLNLNGSGTKNFFVNEKVNPAEILFISNAPLEDIRGTVNDDAVTGTLAIDPSNVELAQGVVKVNVRGMETGIKNRNKHLFSSEWLDADTYPDIIFNLLKLSNVKSSQSETIPNRASFSADAAGTITIHGKSKNIIVPISMTYIKESAETKQRAPGDFIHVSGNFDVSLKDFDISGTQGIVGTKVGEIIKINFSLFYSSK